MKKIRIGFTGSGGSGKTTMLKVVSEKLKIPTIPEGIRSYLKANGISHLRELGDEGTIKLQEEVLSRKIKAESKFDAFITDRTTLDNAAYALRWLSRCQECQEWLNDYINKCLTYARNYYDIIFFFPCGMFELEDDGIRSGKFWYQYEIDLLLKGLMFNTFYQQSHYPAIYVLETISIQERLEEIEEIIKEHLDGRQGTIPNPFIC